MGRAALTAAVGTGLLALGSVAGAGGLGDLKGMAGGADLSSLTSGSTGNVAGIVEFCIKNNYLGGDAAGSVKDQLLGKLGGSDESETDRAGYADGAKGLLKTSDGKSVDLADMGGLKGKMTEKVCSSVLDQAKSLL
jgi:hypothetical protein